MRVAKAGNSQSVETTLEVMQRSRPRQYPGVDYDPGHDKGACLRVMPRGTLVMPRITSESVPILAYFFEGLFQVLPAGKEPRVDNTGVTNHVA